MVSPNAPLDQYQLSWLDIAIRAVWYEHGRQATLTLPRRASQDRLQGRGRTSAIRACATWACSSSPSPRTAPTDGSSPAPPPLELDRDFIVLELEELKAKKDLQAVVLLMLMYRITREMYLTRERRKLVIVDEAWELLRGVATGEFLEAGYRRARKYNGAFITGTQSIEDYTKSAGRQRRARERRLGLHAAAEARIARRARGVAAPADERDDPRDAALAADRARRLRRGLRLLPDGLRRRASMIFDPFTLLLASSRAEDMLAVDALPAAGALHGGRDRTRSPGPACRSVAGKAARDDAAAREAPKTTRRYRAFRAAPGWRFSPSRPSRARSPRPA